MDGWETLNTEFEASAYNWWQLQLFGVIRDCHPYMLTPENRTGTLKIIAIRAEAAKSLYEKRILEGVPHFFAQEEAREEILIGDLIYSPTDFIAEIVYDITGNDLEDEQKIEIYNKVKHLFKQRAYMHDHPEEEEEIAEEIKNALFCVLQV